MTSKSTRRFTLTAAAVLLAIAGCTAPTRVSNPEAFKVVRSGRFVPAKSSTVVECVTDGFTAATHLGQPLDLRQSRRADGYRIDLYAINAPVLLLSADLMDDGTSELHESSKASMTSLSGEYAAFDACIKAYRQPGS